MTNSTVIKTSRSSLDKWRFHDMPLLEACCEEVRSRLIIRPQIRVYGKICHQNRNIGFFSDDSIGYRYSGQLARSQPLTENLKALIDVINEKTGSNFNGILVNEYLDGTNCIGAHSDDESGLGNNGVVGISVGARRKFRIRHKHNKQIYDKENEIFMESGDVIHMKGDFQKEFTHEIPVEKRVKAGRISFTFRYHTV